MLRVDQHLANVKDVAGGKVSPEMQKIFDEMLGRQVRKTATGMGGMCFGTASSGGWQRG